MSSALIIILFLSLPIGLFVWSFYRLAESAVAAIRVEKEEESRFSRTLVELANQKRRELTNLKIVELDYETGKVSEPHYEAYRNAAKERIVLIMRRLDQVKETFQYSEQIEETLEGLGPETNETGDDVLIESPVENILLDAEEKKRIELLAVSSSGGRACTKCGESVVEKDRFCAQCGQPLRAD